MYCSSRQPSIPVRKSKSPVKANDRFPLLGSGVEVEIEAGEVIENLPAGVHGLLAPTSHIGAASLFVATADQHVYRGVGERMYV
jgi:hypothetical protein